MKVIITDLEMVDIGQERAVFEKAGVPFELMQLHTEDDVIEHCKDADVLAVQYAPISERVLRALPQVKCVIRYGVGVDNIDVGAATRLGVQIGNVPDYGMNEVSDHAIAMALGLLRKVALLNEHTKKVKWDYSPCIPIHRFSALTVSVIGLGRIGRTFARKMAALGFSVLGYDPYFTPTEETDAYVTPVSFDEAITRADVLSLHCPAEGNQNLIDSAVLHRMKPTAILINAARGAIVNDRDLDQALRTGEIAAAAVDTVNIEPAPKDYFLFSNENLIVTPHMAWYSEEAGTELQRKVAEEAVRFLTGEPMHYPVNHPV